MKKHLAAVALAIAAVLFLAGSALAHGCHHDVERDRYGWHRHSRNNCIRIDVERPHIERPRCVQKCHYIGPFKECKTICD